jgi:hypothetical protein
MITPDIAARLQDPSEFGPKDYTTLPLGALLGEYGRVLSLLDVLSDLDRRLSELRSAQKDEFIRRAEIEGVEKFSGAGLTVTVKNKTVVRYDPEKWDLILKSLVENGYGYCVHRQLSAAKVQELMDSGVRLPDGLSLDSSIKEVSHRRTT